MMKVSDIKLNMSNPRIITPERREKLKESLIRNPRFMELRGLILDEDNMIKAGSQRFDILVNDLGYEEIPDEWIKFARDFTEEELKEFVVIDNISFGDWDYDIIGEDYGFDEVQIWGLQIPEWDKEQPEDNTIYTKKIQVPIYEPKNEKPEVFELVDQEKYKELCRAINDSKLPKNEKDFLKLAAARHLSFNYALVADYYAQAPKELQELMEDSALVIIDFNKAIENGYIELSDKLNQLFNQDYDEETE